MKFILALIFVSTFASNFRSQENLNSIRHEFYSNEENRIQNAIKLRDFYLDESPDSIYNIGSYLINEGIQKEQASWLNFGKLIISSFYNKKGKTKISKENLQACIKYYNRKRDFELLADAQNLMGVACMFETQNREAINWFLKSLQSAQNLDTDNQSFMAHLNMSEAFLRLENYDSAEKEANSFLQKVKKQKLNKGLRKGYYLLSRIYFATERNKESFVLLEKCLNLAYENGDKLGLTLAINNIAIAYIEDGNLEKAESYFRKALKLRLEINDPSLISESYYNLGELNYLKEHYDEAINYYEKSKEIAHKSNLLKENADAIKSIGECFEMKNDYKAAYLNFVEYNLLQEELISQLKKDDAKIDENYSKFKEKEFLLDQKKREDVLTKRVDSANNLGLIMFVLTILILGFVLFSKISTKSKNS